MHKYIIVKKEGNKLIVKLKNNLRVLGKETLNVYIKAKQINNIEGHGDARIDLENPLTNDNLTIYLSGDSFIYGEINATLLKMKLTGDSKADLYGDIKKLDAELTGDSYLKDYDLDIEDLKIKLLGDSEAYVSVTDFIDVEARGDSKLFYKGNPTIVNQELSGDSKVIKK
jgi:hypothetical protein